MRYEISVMSCEFLSELGFIGLGDYRNSVNSGNYENSDSDKWISGLRLCSV